MITIGTMTVASVFLGFYIYLRRFRSKPPEPSTRLRSVFQLAAPIGLAVYVLISIQSTPQAKSISDEPKITDATQQLSIQSIAMPAPAYLSGDGVIEKTHTSVVAVEVANSSDQELYLGMWYYANSGSMGFYKPGAYSGERILPVPANWSGQLEFPLRHLRFVKEGKLRLTFAKCFGPSPEHSFPIGEEPLFEKTYDMVSQR
jgi:hypothetical protein